MALKNNRHGIPILNDWENDSHEVKINKEYLLTNNPKLAEVWPKDLELSLYTSGDKMSLIDNISKDYHVFHKNNEGAN